MENAAVQGAVLLDGLKALKEQYWAIGDARGLGLMQALEFVDENGKPDAAAAARVQQTAISEGLLLLTCGAFGNVVRVIPALVVTEAEIAEGVDAIARTLKRSL